MKRLYATEEELERLVHLDQLFKDVGLSITTKFECTNPHKGAERPFRAFVPYGGVRYFDDIETIERWAHRWAKRKRDDDEALDKARATLRMVDLHYPIRNDVSRFFQKRAHPFAMELPVPQALNGRSWQDKTKWRNYDTAEQLYYHAKQIANDAIASIQ